MKNKFRSLMLFLVCFVSVLALTSCNMLDELRAERVDVLDEDGSVLEYRGTKYKKLPESININVTHCVDNYLHSVDSDVPLLLTDAQGESCYYCVRKDILIKDRFLPADKTPQFFCTLDKYEEYCEALKLKELECYKFEYRERDTVTGRYLETESYILDEELTEIINEAVTDGKQEQIKGGSGYDNWTVVTLSKCDSNDLVELKNSCMLFYDNKGNYGVIVAESSNTASNDITVVWFSEEYEQSLSKLFTYYEYLLSFFSDFYVEQ